MRKLLTPLILCLSSIPVFSYSQTAYINTVGGIYQLTNGAGNCTNVSMVNQCPEPGFIMSLALHKDTIYYNTSTGILKRFKVGVPGSCEVLGSVGGYNSMTVDPNGIIYLVDFSLHRYNPYTNVLTHLGTLPFASAGDLFFFNGKLLLAGNPAGIYEVNITNPAASSLYMSTNGRSFFGLVSFPASCNNIKFYGLEPKSTGGTMMVELDLVTKSVVGTVCDIPLNVFDAASVTESGINQGIIVTRLDKQHPCPPATSGSVLIQAMSTVQSNITYSLDNTVTNATGVFNNLVPGNHTIHMVSSNGCTKDTTFTIATGLNPAINITKSNPDICDANNGAISITASSNHTPINYKLLNTGLVQTSGNFVNLGPNIYQFQITDAVGCSKDTTVLLQANTLAFVNRIETGPSHCGLGNGLAKIVLNTAETSVLSSIDNGAFTSVFQYTGLTPGSHYLQVKKGTCYFDTTIVIANINDEKPVIQVEKTNQFCYANNGSINLQAMGNNAPYTYKLNNGAFSTQQKFTGLAPGNYSMTIRNSHDCSWDTFAVIAAYPHEPAAVSVQHIDPLCKKEFEGSITVNITGSQHPYSFMLNGQQYNNGQTATGLTAGTYAIQIVNSDQCKIDTVDQELIIPYEQHCNEVFMPNAFTPNNDGKNDRLQPGYTSFIKDLHLEIFNRYGQKIYEGKGAAVSWDGKYRGIDQPPAVYVYMITYADYYGTRKHQKGTLTLIR